jgi:hypothetical protein
VRLGCGGSANQWQFAIYRISHHDYEALFPTGLLVGATSKLPDTACDLYLTGAAAWA